MKYIACSLILSTSLIATMEPMIEAAKRLPLSRDLCAKIATIKSMKNPIVATTEQSYVWTSEGWDEKQVFSKTWLSTTMTPEVLFEKQLWVSEEGASIEVRFDNDTSHDCNIFRFQNLGTNHHIGYDGPNNDGDKSAIEGSHKGVILMLHSYDCPHNGRRSRFYLFKQHGISAKEYQGVQKKVTTSGLHGYALTYQGFPYASEPLAGHNGSKVVALASKQRGIIGTVDGYNRQHLHAFEYDYEKNETDASKSDQFFTVRMIAHAHGVPEFKRLAWLYGKTLLGLCCQNNLYVVTVDEKTHAIVCHKQKTDKKFKDFALGRPYSHHEMVLVDEQNQLYYANLKYHKSHGRGFLYKKIINRIIPEDQTSKKAKADNPKSELSCSEIKRIWMYGDLVGLHQARVSPGKELIGNDLQHNTKDGFINYLSLRQAKYTPEDIAYAELITPKSIATTQIENKRKQADK